jgi:methionyl aminopeptidase
MDWLKKVLGIATAPGDVKSLGRNDSCWCGSGEKYKRCHMESDKARERARTSVSCVRS